MVDSAPLSQYLHLEMGGSAVESWQELMELSDDELASVDVAKQHLLCAKGLPGAENLSVRHGLRKIDRWAEEVRNYTRDNWFYFRRNPGEFRNSANFFKMVVMITFLQRELGVHYRRDLMDGPLDWRDCRGVFLNGILSGYGGTCTSMPVIYTAIGRRLGYPLHLVGAKAHLFCRWEDENERFNVEAAGQGMNSYPDEHYHTWPIPLTAEDIAKGHFLHNKAPRESLAWFIAERGGVLRDNMEYEEALKCYYHAHELWPNDPNIRGFHAVGSILYLFNAGLATYEFDSYSNCLTRVCIKGHWRNPQRGESWAANEAKKDHRRIQVMHGGELRAVDQYFNERN